MKGRYSPVNLILGVIARCLECIIFSGSRGPYELRAQNLEAGIKELLAVATAAASSAARSLKAHIALAETAAVYFHPKASWPTAASLEADGSGSMQ